MALGTDKAQRGGFQVRAQVLAEGRAKFLDMPPAVPSPLADQPCPWTGWPMFSLLEVALSQLLPGMHGAWGSPLGGTCWHWGASARLSS